MRAWTAPPCHGPAGVEAVAEAGELRRELRRELAARRQSEAQLECLLMLLGAVLESSIDGILVFNREGRVVRFNQRLVELFAIPDDITAFWEHERLMACLFSRFEDPVQAGREIAGWFEAPQCEFQQVIAGRGGRTFECHGAAQPEGVESVGRVISFRDISERIRTQEALLREKEEQRLLISQLGDARRQAAQSEQQASIGRLAAGLAHEINNPIGFVKSNLGRLSEYLDDLMALLGLYRQAEPGLVGESFAGVERVQRIVRDLQDFSHAGEGEWQYADLHRGFDSTLAILQAEIRDSAEIVREYGALPEIECSPAQINQLFMHLLVNAVHALKPEGGRITVRTGAAGAEVRVEIADDGEGIPPENLERIFEPFFTTRPAGRGTGLGLPVAACIVHRHRGRIEVESEPGRGSVFRITLPIRQGERRCGGIPGEHGPGGSV